MNKRWATPGLFVLLVWLFYVASKGAYKGFFSADDLDNLAWTRHAGLTGFFTGLISPQFFASNFRPVGHFYFWALGHLAGLDFRPYIAVLHGLHLINLGLLWALLDRLMFSWAARAIGVIFFAFHMAVFDAYWKPMYVFDVLCALFSLLSVILWIDKRRWLSFLCFWLAYKSKELAVAVPLILAAYEYFLGSFSIRALAVHLAGGALFAAQALFSQGGRGGDYGLRLTPVTLWQTIDYYASEVLLVRHAGFGLALLPVWIRDRRLWWGLLAGALWLGPMLLVPGRLFGAYLYLPLAGLAVAMAALTERIGWKWIAVPLAVWLGFNYAEMRNKRRATLAEAEESTAYVFSLADLAKNGKDIDTVLIDSAPAAMRRWGVEGALRYTFDRDDLEIIYLEDVDHKEPRSDANLAMLSWDAPIRRLHSLRRTAAAGDAAYLEMTRLTPVWQLTKGWYQREGGNYRWTAPKSYARVRRPAGANEFQVTVNVGPDYIRAVKSVTLTVRVNGAEIGSRTYMQNGWLTEKFTMPPGPEGNVDVEFSVDPPFRPINGDPRTLGIPIAAFGFR
ncbi:MAG: hypothetical protein HYX27_23650 [Acidobacteria bacterium]|nr:hypothetical protein [Acidobacteriota bacterium]